MEYQFCFVSLKKFLEKIIFPLSESDPDRSRRIYRNFEESLFPKLFAYLNASFSIVKVVRAKKNMMFLFWLILEFMQIWPKYLQ